MLTIILELLEGLREGIVVLDHQGDVLYANKNAYRMLGVQPEEKDFSMLMVKKPADLYMVSDRRLHKRPLALLSEPL